MMNHERLFLKLIARARQAPCPRVDVARRVMAAIYAGRMVTAPPADALLWVAAVSFVVAVPVAVFALTGSQTWVDPLMAALVDLPGWLI